MKIRKHRKVIRLGLCAVLLFSMMIPCGVGAATNTVSSISTAFTRSSSDSADAYVHAVCLAPSKIESKVTLESAEPGTSVYTQAYRPIKKTVYNSTTITQEIEYGIDEDLDYRIKVEVTDTYNGLSATVTTYHYLEDPSDGMSFPQSTER